MLPQHRMRFAPSQLLAVKLQALQLLAPQLLRPQSSGLFRFLRATYQRDWSCPRPVSSFIGHPGVSALSGVLSNHEGFSPKDTGVCGTPKFEDA